MRQELNVCGRETRERGGRWGGDGGVRDMEEGEGWGGQAA